MANMEDVNHVVTAAVCLHNICIWNGDLGEEYMDPDTDDYDPNLFENIVDNDAIGTTKRDQLVALVNNV